MMTFLRNPTLRIAMGLVGLVVSLFVLADVVFGLLPDRESEAREWRSRVAESITVQTVEFLRNHDLPRAQALLDALRTRSPEIVSIAVRDSNGKTLVRSGPHAADWTSHSGDASTSTRVVVPIHSAQGRFGRAEFSFNPVLPTDTAGWLRDRALWLALGLPTAALLLVYLYLRRSLVHLNPMSVVPDRLRAAFDGLTEGVALLDARARVVLANTALREMAAVQGDAMHGLALQRAAHLTLADATLTLPWDEALKSGSVQRGTRVYVGEGSQRKVGAMNCAPILDPKGRVRGCLVTVDDLTATERANEDLKKALAELERSREQIEKQNQELVKLATRDGLTGLLNRRAFFDTAGGLLARHAREGTSVAVLMLDVDHFKSFNDKHGHAVGDQVLQSVAKQVSLALRQQDLVARYGGEEFCVLLENVNESNALELAERVRSAVQHQAGRGIRDGRDLLVTTSVGVCISPPGPSQLSELLKRADAALYEAKRSGRNRVVMAQEQEQEQVAPALEPV